MPALPSSSGNGARPSVCIVTAELIGLFKNGGIGTAMTGLAEHLARAGFPVTVVYTGGSVASRAELSEWRDRYESIGIALDAPDPGLAATAAGPVASGGFTAPFLVYRYLRERRFDVVAFNDCMGEGVYCLAMKRLGAAFAGTALLVGLHSPSQWIFEINRTPPSLPLFGAFNFAERLSVALADLLWSPSRYLLDWTSERGFRHPGRTVVQRYALPSLPLFGGAEARIERPARDEEPQAVSEIVFFGRLEERKGLRLFCEALGRIEAQLHERRIAVTFLGKPGAVGNVPAAEFLERASATWRFPSRRISDLGREEALDWLLSRPALAVIASPADNSPCTVYEALAHGIPFLAARSGGIPELVDERDHEAALFDHGADDLAAKLLAAIERGVRRVRPAQSPKETIDRWIDGLEGWKDYVRTPEPPGVERRLCVLIDGEDETSFAASLASLDPGEISRAVLIARSSAHGEVKARVPVAIATPDDPQRLLDSLGAEEGEAIVMLRNGAVLEPGAGRAIIRALSGSEADGIVPAASVGPGPRPRIVLPLGSSPSFCLYEGAAPAGLMAVRAERLAAAVGGRLLPAETEFFGLGDFAIAAGLDIWPYPEPLVSHPGRFTPERPGRGARERLAAYSEAEPTERLYMTARGYEEFAARAGLAGALRAVRRHLIALGFKRVTEALIARVPERLSARLRRTGRS